MAETVTVISPLVAQFLESQHWSGKQIGMATAMPGLGVMLTMAPVGLWLDHANQRRRILALAALGTGSIFAALSVVPIKPRFIDALMRALSQLGPNRLVCCLKR